MAQPVDQAWRAEIVPRELRRQADSVRQLAATIAELADFPTETPRKLCALIGATAEALSAALTAAPADQLRHVNEFLRELTTHLRFAERSRLEQTPWSMVQATEAFLKRQVGDDAHFIIRPQWSYNYGLVSEFVAVYRHRLKALSWVSIEDWEQRIGAVSNGRIYCISFPRLERLNALLHTCWGHEVGHITAQGWTQQHFNGFWLRIEPSVSAACKAELQKQKAPTQDQLFWDFIIGQQVADWTKQSLEIARFGINELISDAVGVHLFGGAAFAASAELCANWDLDASPINAGGYPPWRYRLRLLAESCKSDLDRFKPDGDIELSAELGPFVTWLRKTTAITTIGDDRSVLQSDPRTRETYHAIQREWPDIRDGAVIRLPPLSPPYRLSERVAAVEELVRRLDRGIPPNETGVWPNGQPAAIADILNAGWAFKLKRISADPKWGDPSEFDQLFRLLLKAVEASHVHGTYGPKLKVDS